MLTRKTRWLLATGLTLFVALVVGARWLSQPKAEQMHVLTAPAAVRDLEDTVLATGKLEPKALVSVGAQVSGQLKTLRVKVGQAVKAGELIAEIDAEPQRNQLKGAQLAVTSLKAQRAAAVASLNQAKLAYERQKKLLEMGLTSKADYDQSDAARQTAEANIAALDAQLEKGATDISTAEVNLGYTRIVAPMDGVVVSVVTKQGQTVNSMQSAPTIVMLAQLDTMTIKAQVSEADVARVAPGQVVWFTTLGNSDRRYYAKVGQIEPAPESIASSSSTQATSSASSSSSAIYYNALFDVPNKDGSLYTSMTANVNIVVGSAKRALVIPASALVARDADGRYVVRVPPPPGQKGPPRERKVRIGINNKVDAQVLEGLQAGELVVTGSASGPQQDQGPMRGPF